MDIELEIRKSLLRELETSQWLEVFESELEVAEQMEKEGLMELRQTICLGGLIWEGKVNKEY